MSVRNRIVRHVRVRASALVPHEMNPRRHGEEQRQALQALYDEIGFARSLLAYELPDGRLKLIDGHLRAELSPDLEVDVEVLDVSDAEARALLLSIDPLAQLASYDASALDELRQITTTDSDVLRDLWQAIAAGAEAVEETLNQARNEETVPEQFLILVTCKDEAEQSELLTRFQDEGLPCKALLS